MKRYKTFLDGWGVIWIKQEPLDKDIGGGVYIFSEVHIRTSVVLDWILLLVHGVLALVVSLDTQANISLYVLTSVLFVIISMYFLLRGIY